MKVQYNMFCLKKLFMGTWNDQLKDITLKRLLTITTLSRIAKKTWVNPPTP